MKVPKKYFRIGDLVVNTYIGSVRHGKLGMVWKIEPVLGDIFVRYENPVEYHRLTGACLEIVSASR